MRFSCRRYLHAGAVHFSILGGRILFKDLRYHSSNQTVKIVKGHVSWRYWLRHPAEEEDLSRVRVVGEDTNCMSIDICIWRSQTKHQRWYSEGPGVTLMSHTCVRTRDGMVHIQPDSRIRQHRLTNEHRDAI